jgi:palmitoyltransferase ZDHHC3/7/25
MNWGRLAGRTCVLVVYSVMGFAWYFFVFLLGLPWAMSNWLILFPVCDISARIAMALWSHTYCMLSDPGWTGSDKTNTFVQYTSEEKILNCKKCGNVRFPRTHHCSVCGRCVEKMDHHCPWVNNCVGVKNHKSFLLFLAYTSSAAVECLILVALRLVSCPSVSKSFLLLGLRLVVGEARVASLLGKEDYVPFEPTCDLTVGYSLAGVCAIILASVFTVFMAFIASDQLAGISSNQTGIEQIKGVRGPERTARETAIEVMGMEPSLWWLLPIDWRWKKKGKIE